MPGGRPARPPARPSLSARRGAHSELCGRSLPSFSLPLILPPLHLSLSPECRARFELQYTRGRRRVQRTKLYLFAQSEGFTHSSARLSLRLPATLLAAILPVARVQSINYCRRRSRRRMHCLYSTVLSFIHESIARRRRALKTRRRAFCTAHTALHSYSIWKSMRPLAKPEQILSAKSQREIIALRSAPGRRAAAAAAYARRLKGHLQYSNGAIRTNLKILAFLAFASFRSVIKS